jgi:hypothetical protein
MSLHGSGGASARLRARLTCSLLIAPLLLGLVACTGSTPPAPSAAKPAPTRSASPTAGADRASASPQASPGPVAAVQIVDATLADATPWVMLRLTGGEPIIVTGWKLQVGDQTATIPDNAILQPGETLTLHAGDGRSSDREIYLGAASEPLALAASPGASVRLLKPTGEVVAETTVPRF